MNDPLKRIRYILNSLHVNQTVIKLVEICPATLTKWFSNYVRSLGMSFILKLFSFIAICFILTP